MLFHNKVLKTSFSFALGEMFHYLCKGCCFKKVLLGDGNVIPEQYWNTVLNFGFGDEAPAARTRQFVEPGGADCLVYGWGAIFKSIEL